MNRPEEGGGCESRTRRPSPAPMHDGVTIHLEAMPDRRLIRALAKRDPRAEKRRDFRKSRRHNCRGGCKLCRPEKNFRALVKARRRERKRIGLTPLSP